MFDDRSHQDPAGTRAAVAALFAPKAVLARIIHFEAVLAEVQGDLGLIPNEAAEAIRRAALDWTPDPGAVQRHRDRVGHPMVAILEAFGAEIDPEGREWLHFGTTTADVFRTVMVQQLHATAAVMDAAMVRIEAQLADLARTHRATPMIGRTLGRHALPITFGYKVSVWLSELRRDRERLAAWRAHFDTGVLSGAVGTHAAMGTRGPEVERRVMARLGLGAPDPVDTKGALDIFAEIGAAMVIAGRGCQRDRAGNLSVARRRYRRAVDPQPRRGLVNHAAQGQS
ncbi:lyase family protein [Pararhodobacter zhoushanensis]|uniref:Lyase family protein n=1 Tax=Pararhodobacter zhoushanensis TaxID=2479545 RepID=A0ABT3GXN1_9RHOB|nr:lyase family protein [Pararhodobacter zhoushanensis]MCW1932282.1 lyase family protein [Pararhodobacter zhoushanensis]